MELTLRFTQTCTITPLGECEIVKHCALKINHFSKSKSKSKTTANSKENLDHELSKVIV